MKAAAMIGRAWSAAPRRLIAHAALVAALALLAAASLAACGSPAVDEAALDGTSWQLSAWSVSSADPADFEITADFADGRVGGRSAVNSYSGAYTTGADGAFSTGPLASTEMAGPEPAMRAEQAYLELLGAAKSYKLEGDRLTLMDGGGNDSLVFTAATQE